MSMNKGTSFAPQIAYELKVWDEAANINSLDDGTTTNSDCAICSNINYFVGSFSVNFIFS